MTFTESLVTGLCKSQTLVILAVLSVTYYVTGFIRQVWRLPKGPTPLPILGNILQLRAPRPLYEKAMKWSKFYGDPITIYLGIRPMVIASSKESLKEVSGPLRNIVAGRMKSKFGDIQSRGQPDIIFADMDASWDVVRRLTHAAIRKYAQTEALAKLVAQQVDAELHDLFEPLQMTNSGTKVQADGSEKVRTEIVSYVEDIINNVVAVSAFGECFKKGDPDYDRLRAATKSFEEKASNGLPSDILWILGVIFYQREQAAIKSIQEFLSITDKMFSIAAETFVPGKSRHFTDTLLNAREQFIADDHDSAKYLKDESLRQALADIFVAGISTSKTILGFSFLLLANDPELQEELREEILHVLGDRICLSSDRQNLPKVDAFIQEVIRFFPPAPVALPRRALANCRLNGHFIPKDMALLLNVYAVNRDPDIWGPDAESFNSKRFLTATNEQISKGMVSFGTGARACPGEKMAQADIFYTIVRTLQMARLSCPDGPGTANLESIDSDILIDTQRQDLDFEHL